MIPDIVRRQAKPSIPTSPDLVYLGGPIDFAPGDARGWREVAAADLSGKGVATFSPAHAFVAGGVATDGLSQRLMSVNFCAIWESDLILINLGTTVSVGTSREIHQAILWDKPVLVVSQKQGHYLVDCHVVPTLAEALSLIKPKDLIGDSKVAP